jgi:3-methyladenine DNA glycosylase AlkC
MTVANQAGDVDRRHQPTCHTDDVAAALKDEMNGRVVEQLAGKFGDQYSDFDVSGFARSVNSELGSLELKDRIDLIADAIAEYLPTDYRVALDVVCGVAEAGIDAWAAWPLCSFVERHGVEHPEPSLAAMPLLTKRWSCEFAIRPFLDRHLELARRHLRQWVHDDDEAVRRLSSEGTRPFLPWAPKVAALIDDPQIGIEFLTVLRHDPTETVRRSVANHLNDLTKFEPDLVVELLGTWIHEPEPVDPKMVSHALRTLVKRGHPDALQLLGFSSDPEIVIGAFTCVPREVEMGDQIVLEATLTSAASEQQRLVVDFVVHHVNANGATSPKVFKWTNVTLAANEELRITKRRTIQQASTRTYRAGTHRVDLQIGGRVSASTEFVVVIA